MPRVSSAAWACTARCRYWPPGEGGLSCRWPWCPPASRVLPGPLCFAAYVPRPSVKGLRKQARARSGARALRVASSSPGSTRPRELDQARYRALRARPLLSPPSWHRGAVGGVWAALGPENPGWPFVTLPLVSPVGATRGVERSGRRPPPLRPLPSAQGADGVYSFLLSDRPSLLTEVAEGVGPYSTLGKPQDKG